MRIEIDPIYEPRIKEIADYAGRSIEELIAEAIEDIIFKAMPRNRERLTEAEHAAMMAGMERIRNLPLEGIDDGAHVARDHDKYIYRIDW